LVSKVKKELPLVLELVETRHWYGVVARHVGVTGRVGRKVGEIRVRRDQHLPRYNQDPHTPCYQVADIEVAKPMRRRGVATALYHAAAEVAFAEGFSLCSDAAINLSTDADAVWESLRRKRIAYWEVPGDIDSNFDYGRYVIPRPTAQKS
jgi:GNAT superfamily N-acetyltransferase